MLPANPMRVPDYAAPIRAFRVWRVTVEVDEQALYNAITMKMLNVERFAGYVPTLSMVRPDPILASWNMGIPWGIGWNHAVCLLETHDAPQFDCKCGQYAMPNLGILFDGEVRMDYSRGPFKDGNKYFVQMSVPGVVELRGRIIEHEHGYRAEYARPYALLDASRHSPWLVEFGPLFGLITALYGMHLTPFPQLLEEFVTFPDRYDAPPAPNSAARLLVGGPAHGTVMNVNGSPDTLLVPYVADVRSFLDQTVPAIPTMRHAEYGKMGNNSYRYERDGAM